MDFYVIPPNSQLDLMHLGNRYFCLAQHYYNNEEYRNFFKAAKAQGKWITLDNGAGDHALITEDILMWCVKDLMPNEVIPPDTLFDAVETLDGLRSFYIRMAAENLCDKVEIFAVPQGSTKQEWIDCYEAMLNVHFVKTIGMSKLGIPHAWLGEAKDDQGIMEARHMAVDYLLENNLIKKPLHFLGAENPNEFKKYVQLENPLFRSTDSCFSIFASINDFDWSLGQFNRIPTPKNYFDLKMSDKQILLAKKNINWLADIFKVL